MNIKNTRWITFSIIYITIGIFSYFFWDRPVAYFYHHLDKSLQMNKTVHFISDLALGWYYVVAFPIIALILLDIQESKLIRDIARALVFLWLCVIFSGVVCDILKIVFGRARPDELFEHQYYGFYWFQFHARFWSFPSGHTTVIAAVMTGLTYLKPRFKFVFLLIALIISFMRIVLAQHYISDVMASFYLVFICVHYLHAFYIKQEYNFPKF